jgi:pimeloyl-ACP methyl ester carboxylesterase
MWAPFLPAFAARHTVYTMDALGEAGASVQTAPFAVAADRARALDEVFAELGLTGVHLVGASGGGWLAVNQVLHAPDRVATLSLLDPTTVVTQFSVGVMWRAVLMTVLRSKRLLRRLVVYSAGVDVMDRPEVRVTLVGARTYQLRLPMSAPPPRDALRAIRLPVLAVFAGRSSVHNSALAAHRARELMPHASVEVWPEARHDMGAFADTRPITDRVLAFLG